MAEIHEHKAAEHRRLAALKSAERKTPGEAGEGGPTDGENGTVAEVAGRASEENDRPA
jgi:hypothetical protein